MMSMQCPRCQECFREHTVCPKCKVKLEFQLISSPAAPLAREASSEWQQSPAGKIFIGLVLAQGLSFGLQHFLIASHLAEAEHHGVWQTLWGLVALHVIHAVAVLAGAVISGSGQKNAVINGSLVGLASSLITVGVLRQNHELFAEFMVIALPILHLAIGALGGFLGQRIWQPMPELLIKDLRDRPKPPREFNLPFLAGPVHWGRVFAGIFVVVMGAVWSNAILEFVLKASNGKLAVGSNLQAQLICWEISALATLAGAGFAGANSFNGLKQGLMVGTGAGVVILGMQMGSPGAVLELSLLTVLGTLLLTLAGGWFGAQLLPPILANPRRRTGYY